MTADGKNFPPTPPEKSGGIFHFWRVESDYHFDYQTMYENVLFCMYLYLWHGIRKTPKDVIPWGFGVWLK